MTQMDPVAHVERQVKIALDDLVTIGALQKSNWMEIESLLNPAGKSHVLTESSDTKIYQAIIDAIDACANIEINSGDDVDDDDIPPEPRPTQHDVLKAASTIGRYSEGQNRSNVC